MSNSLVGFALDCKQFDPKKEAIEHEESQKVPPVRRGQTPLQALCTVSHGLQSSDWNRGSLGKHRVRVKAGGGAGGAAEGSGFCRLMVWSQQLHTDHQPDAVRLTN